MTEAKLSKKEASLKQRWLRWWQNYSQRVIVSCLLSLFIFVIYYDRIVISIYPGQAGVLWDRFAGTRQTIYAEGLQIISPLNQMYIYDTRIQEVSEEVKLLTADGLLVKLKISIRFYPEYDRLPLLHQKVGPDYVKNMVRPEVISALRSVFGNFKPHEIYSADEEKLLKEIQSTVATKIKQSFVILHGLSLVEIILPEELQQEINIKHGQEQKALAYEFVLQSERQEAIRREIEAEGIRKFEEISGVPILRWRGIEATERLAQSPNSKFVIIGPDKNSLPVILNVDNDNPIEIPQKVTPIPGP